MHGIFAYKQRLDLQIGINWMLCSQVSNVLAEARLLEAFLSTASRYLLQPLMLQHTKFIASALDN